MDHEVFPWSSEVAIVSLGTTDKHKRLNGRALKKLENGRFNLPKRNPSLFFQKKTMT